MLEDRPYMRQDAAGFRGWTASPTLVLLVVNLAVFLLQNINEAYLRWPINRYLALSGPGLLHGYVWQVFTFQFLHYDFFHFFLNGFALFIFGRPVERALGNGRFYEVYFLSGVVGGLCQAILGLLFRDAFGGLTVGASAGVCGLLATFCLIHRDATIQLFFIIPIRAWNFLIGAIAFALFFVVVPTQPGVAHAAHLGGMLTAIAYFQWFIRRERRLFNWRPFSAARPIGSGWGHSQARRSRPVWRRAKPEAPPELSPGEFISQEVDPILDKISAHGIQSLTPREKQILEAARSKMDRR